MTEQVLAGNRVTGRTFYSYSDEYSERITFHKIGSFKLRSISRIFFDTDDLILLNKGMHGESIWLFNYKEGVLIDIEIKERDVINDVEKTRRVEFIYDGRDEPMEVIYKYENGSSQVIYTTKH